MSKVVSTKFVCDECSKEIVAPNGLDGKTVFPYEQGWIYLYSFNSQYWNGVKIDRLVIADSHFCCLECLIKFLEKQYAKKMED
jgi:hypothetical protein